MHYLPYLLNICELLNCFHSDVCHASIVNLQRKPSLANILRNWQGHVRLFAWVLPYYFLFYLFPSEPKRVQSIAATLIIDQEQSCSPVEMGAEKTAPWRHNCSHLLGCPHILSKGSLYTVCAFAIGC